MPVYEGLYVQQRHSERALCLFAFAATADDILSWATIERTLDVPGAAQRMKNESHVRTIRAFMDSAAENIIPTAVSIALRPGSYTVSFYEPTDGQMQGDSQICWARIEIKQSLKGVTSGTVIDGQHRLLALQGHKEQPRILACAILGANDLERALHFVVINNKAKKVSTDLVKGIMAELPDGDREKLKKRLTRVGITLGNYAVALEVLNSDTRSPFRNRVDWDINRTSTRIVKPQALESALRVILSSLRSALEIDVDDAVAILIAMWRGVRDSCV